MSTRDSLFVVAVLFVATENTLSPTTNLDAKLGDIFLCVFELTVGLQLDDPQAALVIFVPKSALPMIPLSICAIEKSIMLSEWYSRKFLDCTLWLDKFLRGAENVVNIASSTLKPAGIWNIK